MDKIYQAIKVSFQQNRQKITMLSLGIILLAGAGIALDAYLDYYNDRFYPRVYIDQVQVGGLKNQEAQKKLIKFGKNKDKIWN